MPLPTRPNATAAATPHGDGSSSGPATRAALDAASRARSGSGAGSASAGGRRKGRGKSQSDACSRAASAWSLASHGKPSPMPLKEAQKVLGRCRAMKRGGGLHPDLAAKVERAHRLANSLTGGRIKARSEATASPRRKGTRGERLASLAGRATARHERLKGQGVTGKQYEGALDRAIAIKRAAEAEGRNRPDVGAARLAAKVAADRANRASAGKADPGKRTVERLDSDLLEKHRDETGHGDANAAAGDVRRRVRETVEGGGKAVMHFDGKRIELDADMRDHRGNPWGAATIFFKSSAHDNRIELTPGRKQQSGAGKAKAEAARTETTKRQQAAPSAPAKVAPSATPATARGPATETAVELAARMKAELERKGGYGKLSAKGKQKFAKVLDDAITEQFDSAIKAGEKGRRIDAAEKQHARAMTAEKLAAIPATKEALRLAKGAARDMGKLRKEAESLADAAEKAGDKTATRAALDVAAKAKEAVGKVRGTPDRSRTAGKLSNAMKRAKAAEAKLTEAQRDPASHTDHAPGHIGPLQTDKIAFDPKRFQYKHAFAETTGSVDSLRGVKNWDNHRAGVVQVWKDPADGKTYVVNGHNRLAKAKQLGVDKVNVMFIDAKDASDARAIGALTNISEGRGTSLDAAKFMRELGVTSKADFEKHDLPVRESVATEGIALAALPKHVFDRVVQGDMPAGKAAIIGASGLSHDRQNELVKLYDKFKGVSGPKLEAWVSNARAADAKVGKKQSLFGDDEEETSDFLHRSDLDEHVLKRLAEEKNAFGGVSKAKRAELLSRAGNQINVEESGRLGDTARENLELYKELNNTSVFSKLKSEHAKKLAGAKGRKERAKVMGDYYDAVVEQAHHAYTL